MQHKRSALAFLLMTSPLVLVACSNDQDGRGSEAGQAAVLTTDVGAEIDDQWAMTHLLLSPEIDLRAIVTTHASSIGLSSVTTAEKATEVLARVFAHSLSTNPPVQAGSDLPLVDVVSPRDSAGVDLLLTISQGFSPAHRLVVFVWAQPLTWLPRF